MSAAFTVGTTYTRNTIAEKAGLPLSRRKGGNWATGYSDWDGQTFIFANVGVPGRTGHDYANRWDGKTLTWFGKTNSSLRQPQINRIIDPNHTTHVFWRGSDGAPFTYAGVGLAEKVFDETPVKVVWSFEQHPSTQGQDEAFETWCRGPRPVAGEFVGMRSRLASLVYVMRLLNAEDCRPTVTPKGHVVVKVGITNDPRRRIAELNSGFPPGSPAKWVYERILPCASADDAWLIEGARLEALRRAGYWIGGEFAALPEEFVREIVPDHWSEGERTLPDLYSALPQR